MVCNAEHVGPMHTVYEYVLSVEFIWSIITFSHCLVLYFMNTALFSILNYV